MKAQEKSWIQSLFAYAEGEKKKMLGAVILSVISVSAGLAPFYCVYQIIRLFVAGTADAAGVVGWCLWALLAYGIKIVTFTLSTGVSHNMAYHVLEGLLAGWRTGSCTRPWATWKTTPSAKSRA